MKKLIVALVLVTTPALAGTRCNTVGSSTYCYDNEGGRSTTNRVGDSSYTYGTTDDGESFRRNCQRIGSSTYCD